MPKLCKKGSKAEDTFKLASEVGGGGSEESQTANSKQHYKVSEEQRDSRGMNLHNAQYKKCDLMRAKG